MLRWLLICRTNSGIRAMRMTTTRPTIESTHDQPPAGSRNSDQNRWNATRIQLTIASSQFRGFETHAALRP